MRLNEYFYYSKYAEILHLTKFELAFCLSYFVLALIICFYSTPKGSLFAPDSIGYVDTAENLYHNLNFISNYGSPLYPILIALGMHLGLSSEHAATIIPIICYSLLGFPLFLLGKIISQSITGYLSCFVCLFCGKYLLIYSTYALTEMPFLFFIVIAILFMALFNRYGYLSLMNIAGMFTFLAILTRYTGLALIPIGIIIIILNIRESRKAFRVAINYCLISMVPVVLWIFVPHGSSYQLSPSVSHSFNIIFVQFRSDLASLFYNDYKALALIMLLIFLISIIKNCLNKRLAIFIRDTISLIGFISIYSIEMIFSSYLYTSGLHLRYILPIFPFVVLLVFSSYCGSYNSLNVNIVWSRILPIILCVLLIAQGANALYSQANNIRMQSTLNYADKERLNSYISEYNISANDLIYFDVSNGYNTDLVSHSLLLYQRNPNIKKRHIRSILGNETILDNLTIPWAGAGPASATSIPDLIRENKNHSLYLIAPFKVLQNFIEQPPEDICFINPVKFSKSFICLVDLKNNETCNTSTSPGYYLIEGNSSIKMTLAGNYMGHNRDQLLISNAKKDTLQIIDFTKASAAKIGYEDKPGASWLTANHSLLSGDFMSLGYDQVLYIAGGKIIIEDFSQGNAPAIIRYSEAPARNSAFGKLVDAGDEMLAGDFLGLGNSQVLFVDRKTSGGMLAIADFSKGKAPEIMQFSEIEGNSTLLGLMLGEEDKRFSGDFMGLGYSQLMMINCNYTKTGEPMIIITDFGKEKRSASVRYQGNWGDSPLFGGWLDANDTQIVGDFMGLMHSQVLLVNHDHKGGKIMIVDFSRGKGTFKYWENWNNGTLFEGCLGLNDTRVAGDFKGLGYSQMIFLNSSINGLNATILDFINGKPKIAL